MRDPRRADDPRLTPYVDSLPVLRAWLEAAIVRAAEQPADTHAEALATAGIYLGIKLCEANRYALSIEKTALLLPRQANLLREYLLGWARLSADVDSFVFAAYGALDALAQALVLACQATTEDEVKFPHLERLLAASPRAARASAIGAAVAASVMADWFRDLRRLRNLVNYRAVLPAAPGGGLPLGQPRAPWFAPPLPTLDRLDALAPYARTTLGHVSETVEALLGLLAE